MNTEATNREKQQLSSDPLGLENVRKIVERILSLRDEDRASGKSGRWAIMADKLEASFDVLLSKYDLLKDRYSLLKRSNSCLAEEVSWLRDQLDDLAFGHDIYEDKEK